MSLHLRLFGRPVIEYNDAPVTELNNRKAEALLFYLALTPGRQRRHHLATLLWSDLSEDKALRNLRYTLWKLRQVLGNVPLEANRLTVSLAPDNDVWVDVRQFKELASTDVKAGTTVSVADLEHALNLYKGDFLTGFELSAAPFFEDWMQQQRDSLRETYINILTRLVGHYTDQQQLDQALATTRRLLDVEPWQEAAHRRLMLLLAQKGQRGAALEHYQHLTQMLTTDLGLEPEPETVAVWEQIRAGQVIPTPAPPADVNTTADDVSPLEQSEEYIWLFKQWEAARQGLDPAAEGRCLQALGDFAREEAYYQQALGHYEAALINFSQTIETRLAAACLISIADTYLIIDQFQPALDCLSEAIAYADAGQHTELRIQALLVLARTHLFLGDFEAAQTKSEAAVTLGIEAGLQTGLPVGLGLQGYLHVLQGNLELAQAQLEKAWSIALEFGDSQMMPAVQKYWGHFHLTQGDYEQALTCFKEAEKSNQSGEIIEALSYQARAHLALGQVEQALNCSNKAIEKLAVRKNGIAAAQRIYLNHYHVLLANRQVAEARSILEIAYQFVSTQLAPISIVSVTTTQRNFLHNLPWNREIAALWERND